LINLEATGKNSVGGGKKSVDTGKKQLAFLPEPAKGIAVIGKNEGGKMDENG
jgi:hypothetical protein